MHHDVQNLKRSLVGSPRNINVRADDVSVLANTGFPGGRHIQRELKLKGPGVRRRFDDELVLTAASISMHRGNDVVEHIPAFVDNSVSCLSGTVLLRPAHVGVAFELDSDATDLTWAVDVENYVASHDLTGKVRSTLKNQAEGRQAKGRHLFWQRLGREHCQNMHLSLVGQGQPLIHNGTGYERDELNRGRSQSDVTGEPIPVLHGDHNRPVKIIQGPNEFFVPLKDKQF